MASSPEAYSPEGDWLIRDPPGLKNETFSAQNHAQVGPGVPVLCIPCLSVRPAVTGGQQPALAGQNPANDDVAEKSAATSSLNASR